MHDRFRKITKWIRHKTGPSEESRPDLISNLTLYNLDLISNIGPYYQIFADGANMADRFL